MIEKTIKNIMRDFKMIDTGAAKEIAEYIENTISGVIQQQLNFVEVASRFTVAYMRKFPDMDAQQSAEYGIVAAKVFLAEIDKDRENASQSKTLDS